PSRPRAVPHRRRAPRHLENVESRHRGNSRRQSGRREVSRAPLATLSTSAAYILDGERLMKEEAREGRRGFRFRGGPLRGVVAPRACRCLFEGATTWPTCRARPPKANKCPPLGALTPTPPHRPPPP